MKKYHSREKTFGIMIGHDFGSPDLRLIGLGIHSHFVGDGHEGCPARQGLTLNFFGIGLFIGLVYKNDDEGNR